MMTPRSATDPEAVEIRLLLEGVFQQYGFDFRDYAYPAVRQRVKGFVRAEGCSGVSELQGRVLRDPLCLERLMAGLTVRPAAVFQDPDFYRGFRESVAPRLRTYPSLRIWHACCSTGEELWSLAVLLHEEGLYRRCRIYATETAESVLEQARAGAYPLADATAFESNHRSSGGRGPLSEYYEPERGLAVFRAFLRDNIVFAQHNVVTDGSFNEFHVVVCRGALIRMNRILADRMHRLIYESLGPFGILSLGRRESLRFSEFGDCYERLEGVPNTYRRVL